VTVLALSSWGVPSEERMVLSCVRSKSLLVFTEYLQDDTHKMCLPQNMKLNQRVRRGGGGGGAAAAYKFGGVIKTPGV
jgi:hypothetical protein